MKVYTDYLEQIFSGQSGDLGVAKDGKYAALGLKFNPFPRSGTTNINGSDLYNQRLIPINESVKNKIIDFISHALNPNPVRPDDKFISATITGNYGSGKTQHLMFVRYLLGAISVEHKKQVNPYVIYIDNPGVKLLEFIGSIISKIGEDNFKKFIWDKIITRIKGSQDLKSRLERFQAVENQLFTNFNSDPYSAENTVSYKKFLDSFVRSLATAKKRKEFDDVFKDILLKILEKEAGNSVLAQYFYDLISEDFGVNKTWEALSTGNLRQLDRKESEIIKYVVRLIKEQGYTDFFILVDEFEDITEGRLSKSQVDNYVYNLRTLLDEHREWCLLFAMTGQALKKLRSVSPPLADRITTRLINLQDLDSDEACKIVSNYVALASEHDIDDENSNTQPFEVSGIKKINELVEGNARKFLKNCYFMVEKAVEQQKSIIDDSFVNEHFADESI
jgi:Cdc6-like AAA superfamily ATPase